MAARPGRRNHLLGGEIRTVDDETNAMLDRSPIQYGIDRMVRRDFQIRGTRSQECQLQITEFFPIQNLGHQIDAKRSHGFFDIADSDLGIPAIVEMNREGAEPIFLDQVSDIRAVDTAAQTDDAVIRLAAPLLADAVAYLGEFASPLLSRPDILSYDLIIATTIVAYACLVEADIRITGGIHNAARAYPVTGLPCRVACF